MKCKVCGFQFEGDRSYCPMCGARAKETEISPEEMQWNTKDFPKPRDVKDIPMRWSSPDATEGYFTMPSAKEKRQAEEELIKQKALESDVEDMKDEESAFQRVSAPEKSDTVPVPAYPNNSLKNSKPFVSGFQKDAPSFDGGKTISFNPASFEKQNFSEGESVNDDISLDMNRTITADREDFQRQLEKEFERLRDSKSEDDFNPPKSISAPAGFGPAYETARPKIGSISQGSTAAFVDLPKQIAQKKPSQTPRQDRFDIDAIEDTIEEIVAAEAKAQAESSERKRKLAAMAAARDAYFKSLDDGEFDSSFFKKNPKYDPKQQVKQTEESLPERASENIFSENAFGNSIPERAFANRMPARDKKIVSENNPVNPGRNAFNSERNNFTAENNIFKYSDPTPETPDLSDLTGSPNDDEERTMKFDKKEFIAAAEKEEAKRQAEFEAAEKIEAQRRVSLRKAEAEDKDSEEYTKAKKLAEENAKLEAQRLAEEQARLEEERRVALEEKLKAEEKSRLQEERIAELEAEGKKQAELNAEIEANKLKAEAEASKLKAEIEAAREQERAKAEEEKQRHEAEMKRLEDEREARRKAREAAEDSWLAALKHDEEELSLEAARQAEYEEEQARIEAQLQAEEQARLEAERKAEEARLEAQRQAEETARLEAERLAAEEASRKEKEEAARIAAKEAADKKAMDEAIQKAREEAQERAQQEAAERVAKLEAEIQAKIAEEEEKRNAERIAQREADKAQLEEERKAIIAAAKARLETERAARVEAEKKLEEERMAAKTAEQKRNVEEAQRIIKEQEKEKQKSSDLGELFKMNNSEIGKALVTEAATISGPKNNIKLELDAKGDTEEMFKKKTVEDHPLYTLKSEEDSRIREGETKKGLGDDQTILEDLIPKRNDEEESPEDTQPVETISFGAQAPITHEDGQLDDIYAEDDIDNHRKHRVLPIIILTVVLMVAVIELGIFLLGKFLPNEAFVKTIISINDAVILSISSFLKSVWDGITKWIGDAAARVKNIFRGN